MCLAFKEATAITLAIASTLGKALHSVVDFKEVISIDYIAVHTVAKRALGQIHYCLLSAGLMRCGAGDPIVFADKDHRQMPCRRHVGRLMERASVGCAVTEEHDRDRAGLLITSRQRCADREALRQKADLIKANLYRIQKGDRTVTVQDYYAEGCPDVTIELDPRKSPQENAAALYKSYRKAKTAEQHLTGLIAEASRNLDYLNSVLDELARAESERDLADIRAELRATGYLRQPRNAKKEKAAPRAPLAFVSSTGYEILVGRSNTQNDELTHRTARRTDIWLHVQKVHGSHVIIRAHDTTPDDQTIAEAASLAVYYSQARGGGKTPVDYTMARFVRKPSGALPGMVLYTDYQTCMAESNEALVERLRVH